MLLVYKIVKIVENAHYNFPESTVTIRPTPHNPKIFNLQ